MDSAQASNDRSIRAFLCGDVMTGRGIDQVLAWPGEPVLYEPYVRNARDYVQLAENLHGHIPRPVDDAYIWGDALAELDQFGADVRIINLETSITRSDRWWRGKEVCYRMNPANVGCLTAAGIDCCCLANNHVLDWGYEGLVETLVTLDCARLRRAGAGRDAAEAAAPAVLDVPGKGRLLVLAAGSPTSGIPPQWAAGEDRPGINLLEELSETAADRLASALEAIRRPGDVAVVSIHWGPNWGYDIPDEQIAFAHRLIEQGVDIVHAHSSHHGKALEIYHDRLILYGCGDFLTDYEGIGGHTAYRGDLGLLYLASLESPGGALRELRLVPVQSRRFRLQHASPADARWLCDLLNRQDVPYGAAFHRQADNSIVAQWR